VFLVVTDRLLLHARGAARAKKPASGDGAEQLFVVLHQRLEPVVAFDFIVCFLPDLAGDQNDVLVIGEPGAAACERGSFEGREPGCVVSEVAGRRREGR
jgi:hypothetical protein